MQTAFRRIVQIPKLPTLHPQRPTTAADTVEWRWSQYTAADDPVTQAEHLIALANAVADLATVWPTMRMVTHNAVGGCGDRFGAARDTLAVLDR